MNRVRLFLRGFAACVLAALALAPARGVAAEPDLNTALPADPKIKMGALPNGMQYWIRQHATPPGKVGIWLHIGSGSINEEDDQQGLAHFLEHMAFNGSENFAPGTLVRFFEKMGMRFGAHQNAFTSFDQTTYIMTMPDAEEETINKGLLYLSDVAYRLTLPVEEIDRERGVVLEEDRARKGAGQRIIEQLLPVLLPGSRVAVRLPIGKAEVIKSAPRERFEAYYKKWYRPDNTVLLAVGDADPAVLERLVKQHFEGWAKAENPAEGLDPKITPYTEPGAAVFTDKELTAAEVGVANVKPMQTLKTVGDFRRDLVQDFGTWILNRRFKEMIQKGEAPFQNASVGVSTFLNVCTYISGSASGEPRKWAEIETALLTEIKRAVDHGFLQQELDDAIKATVSGARQAVKTEDTMNASAFLSRMNSAVSAGRVPLSAEQNLALLEGLIPTIQLEEVSKTFAELFKPGTQLITLELPEKEGLAVPEKAELLKLASKVAETEVAAKEAKARPKALLEKDPEPGEVKETTNQMDLGVITNVYANGVTVHMRSMDFKKNEVWVSAVLPGGELYESAETRGLTDAATLAWRQRATQKLSSTDIRNLMTGRNINVGGSAARDHVAMSISGSTDDLEEGLRLAYLLLTEPKVEASGLELWQQRQKLAIEQQKINVGAKMGDGWRALLYAGDPRVASYTTENVDAITLEAAQKRLDEIVAHAPIEVAMVGDLPMATMKDLAAKYFGSLPKRARTDEKLAELRKVEQKPGPLSDDILVDTVTPKAYVLLGYRTADAQHVADCRAIEFATQVLQGRLREEIREKQGVTYSIHAFAQPGLYYTDSGFLAAHLTCDPVKAPEVAGMTKAVIEKFVAEGPTDEEMATAHKQFKTEIEKAVKEPYHWLGVMSGFDFRGTKWADVKNELAVMTTMDKDTVMAAVKKYLVEPRYLQVIARPKSAAEAKAPDAEQPEAKDAPAPEKAEDKADEGQGAPATEE